MTSLASRKNATAIWRHLLLAFFSCLMFSTALAQDAETSEDIDQQIIDVVLQMWKAVEQQDLDAYLRHIHPDYSVFGESDVYLHEGKEQEARDYADYLSRAKVLRTFMHQPKVTVKGDMAFMTYYWNDAGYIKDKRFTSRGKSTRIFVKEGERWLCIHSHFTAVP